MYAVGRGKLGELLQAPSPFTRIHHPYQVPFPNQIQTTTVTHHQVTIVAAAEVTAIVSRGTLLHQACNIVQLLLG